MPTAAPITFRAYLSQRPGNRLLVTVLSPLLAAPLYRSYPANMGEASAVERSIRHALEALRTAFPRFSEQNHQRNYERHKQCDSESSQNFKHLESKPDVENVHGLPHDLQHASQHASQHAAVSGTEQEGADGYAVKQHRQTPVRVRVTWQAFLPLKSAPPLYAADADKQTAIA